MSEKHGNSRKTLMFNTAAFIIGSVWFVLYPFPNTIANNGLFSFSTIFYVGLYIGLGLLQFFGAWKAFSQMNYTKARNRGFLSWIWIVVVTIIKLFF